MVFHEGHLMIQKCTKYNYRLVQWVHLKIKKNKSGYSITLCVKLQRHVHQIFNVDKSLQR